MVFNGCYYSGGAGVHTPAEGGSRVSGGVRVLQQRAVQPARRTVLICCGARRVSLVLDGADADGLPGAAGGARAGARDARPRRARALLLRSRQPLQSPRRSGALPQGVPARQTRALNYCFLFYQSESLVFIFIYCALLFLCFPIFSVLLSYLLITIMYCILVCTLTL